MSPAATVTSPARSRPATSPARPRNRPQTAPGRVAPPRRHLRSVPPPAPQKRSTRRHVRPRVALTLAIGAFFAVLFGVALLQTVLVQGQIRLDGVRADLSERQATAQVLRAEVSRMESPANIIARAHDLGLVDSGPPTYLLPPPEEALGG